MTNRVNINMALICNENGVAFPSDPEDEQLTFTDKEALESFIWGIVKQKINDAFTLHQNLKKGKTEDGG